MAMNKLLTHDEVIGGTTDNLNSRLKRLAKFSSAGESIGTIQKKSKESGLGQLVPLLAFFY